MLTPPCGTNSLRAQIEIVISGNCFCSSGTNTSFSATPRSQARPAACRVGAVVDRVASHRDALDGKDREGFLLVGSSRCGRRRDLRVRFPRNGSRLPERSRPRPALAGHCRGISPPRSWRRAAGRRTGISESVSGTGVDAPISSPGLHPKRRQAEMARPGGQLMLAKIQCAAAMRSQRMMSLFGPMTCWR